MASRNKDERAHVNALVKAIQKNSPGVYVFIDRDAGNMRHTSSGFDFLLVQNGQAIFCEGKMEKGKLTDYQEFTRALIQASKTLYRVVRFYTDNTFSVDDKKRVAISAAKIEDFLPG